MAAKRRFLQLAAGLMAASLGAFSPPSVAAPPAPEVISAKSERDILSRAANVFNDVTERAMPAVVSISTIKSITPSEVGFHGFPPEFLDPSNPLGGPPDDMNRPRSMGVGSGIIIREDGLVMTNNHVIEHAEKITVSLSTDEKRKPGDRTRTARVLGTDPKSDLALLQLERKPHDPERYPVLRLGNSSDTKVGDWAIAIGSPFGLSRSVSFGIISYIGRGDMGVLDIEDFIQTDAAINPGSSGGPLLNAKGEVIGINTAIFSQGGSFTGIGFAIPSKQAQDILAQLIRHGRVLRGWLGVTAQDLDEQLARHFSVPNQRGALISNVNEKSPAAKARIRAGDVIMRFGNKQVENSSDLKAAVGKTPSGKTISLRVMRDGAPKQLTVVIGEEPRPNLPTGQLAGQAAPGAAGPGSKPLPPSLESLGLAVEDLPREIAEFLGPSVKKGALIVGIRMGSAAFDAGLAPGDIVLKANETDISKAADLAKITGKLKPGQAAVLYVQRGPNDRVFVSLKTGS